MEFMAKRTVWLIVLMLALVALAIACVVYALRDNGLAGSGVFFVQGGRGA